ncbi:MAG: ATP/GTP-binding protein [Kiritimatiellae bacterium]|nr:ATP/GTP-binding protein [Kiritimatiellia bacterium]
MITDFHVKGYRGFEHFALERLSLVNVLVGRNNAGKSSLLEAMQLFATGMSPRVVQGFAMRRGEMGFGGPARDEASVDLSHFFFGHRISDGGKIELGTREIRFELTVSEKSEMLTTSLSSGEDARNEQFLGARYVLETNCIQGMEEMPVLEFYLTSDGLLQAARRRVRQKNEIQSRFLLPEALGSRMLTDLWNKVLVRGEEASIVDAMRILEPRVKSIAFLPSEQPQAKAYPAPIARIVVGLDGESMRLPLGSFGDGMTQLLNIALALVTLRDGVVFIDEVDAGLHYSVMKNLWRLIIKTAVVNNVQVFASTHSLDCLRGLQVFQEEGIGKTGEIVTLHTINPDFPKATRYGMQEIPGIIEHEIEVR